LNLFFLMILTIIIEIGGEVKAKSNGVGIIFTNIG